MGPSTALQVGTFLTDPTWLDHRDIVRFQLLQVVACNKDFMRTALDKLLISVKSVTSLRTSMMRQ